MQKLFKIIGVYAAGVGVIVMLAFCGTDSHAAYVSPTATGRAGTVSTKRMPTMPSMPINVGDISPNLPTASDNSGGGTVNPSEPPKPPVVAGCTDGEPEDSTYTVENCMNDVLACVNNGALPGGLNDLFNYDLRHSIENGMGLCTVQVGKCISEVRKNCNNVYRASSDVWLDFNSHKIQPEYYSFILRKTGLTPNQAENTCWLLDKNTYGSSFNAVANGGATTSEYNGQIGAYNNQAGGLGKSNPQGVKVNNNNSGVDGQRGHYARWDATAGECLIRVAAYNKNDFITNKWLFGALGDDKPAEVWKPAGSAFSCNKDLFGFSLMNNTSTVAAVGIGGGTLVGAGVGAAVGHGQRDFNCENSSHREQLTKELRATGKTGVLNEFLDSKISAAGENVDETVCMEIVELYNTYVQAKTLDVTKDCDGAFEKVTEISRNTTGADKRYFDWDDDINDARDWTRIKDGDDWIEIQEPFDEVKDAVRSGASVSVMLVGENVEESDSSTSAALCPGYKSINKAKLAGGTLDSLYCSVGKDCISGQDFVVEVKRLGSALEPVEILKGEKSNMLKSTLVGAGVGAATGGLATAITAFVEKNNISCRVGDGLEKVSFGKSYGIDSLKDFYVKWNLHLPDAIMPTSKVIDCASWKNACATLTDLNQCAAAQINYQPAGSGATTLVPTACQVSGSVCVENHAVAVSNGACPA